MSETDKTEKESASLEFSKVVDASASFLKSIFPHGYTLIKKIGGKCKKKNDEKSG